MRNDLIQNAVQRQTFVNSGLLCTFRMGFDVCLFDCKKFSEITFANFGKSTADCLMCWCNFGVMIEYQCENIFPGFIVEPQPLHHTTSDIMAGYTVPMEVPAPFIFRITLRFPDIVKQKRNLYRNIIAGIIDSLDLPCPLLYNRDK